jgi:hypothetical protein
MFVHNSTLRHIEIVTFYIKLLTVLIKKKKKIINYFILSKSHRLSCY